MAERAYRPEAPAVLREARRKVAQLDTLLQRLTDLGAPRSSPFPAERLPGPIYFLVCTGRTRQIMAEKEIRSFDFSKYDLFLDVTRGLLFTRAKGQHGKLRRIADTGLLSEDVNTLVFMMEHPGIYFSYENLPSYLPGSQYLESNTFQKRLSRIRRALGNKADCIRRVTDAHYKVSRTGNAYYFDGEGISYCLVLPAESREQRPT